MGDSCCSFGWCSSKNVCEGRKEIGDLCRNDYECVSHTCAKDEIALDWDNKNETEKIKFKSAETEINYKYPSFKKHPSHGICQLKEDEGPFEPITIISTFIAIIALIVIAVALYCLCKFWSKRQTV